jgi:replicative DNA helicase
MLEVVSSQPSSSRQPPHNLEAEKSVLGGVLIKPAAFDEIATGLQVDDFFLPAHREIFEAMLAIDKRQQPLDVIAVADELRVRGMVSRLEGGEAYLLALSNSVPTAENVGHYARLVKEKATLRRLIAACAEIQSRAYGDFGQFEEFLDEAETQVFKVAQQNRRETYSSAGEMMEEVLHNI